MKINFPLLALAIGAFGIGTTEFSPMGLLPVIAKGVDVSIPAAGMLISAYAIGVMVGAPLMTLLLSRARNALIFLMAIFTLGNVFSAISPDYTTLLLSRIITSLNHGAFFGLGRWWRPAWCQTQAGQRGGDHVYGADHRQYWRRSGGDLAGRNHRLADVLPRDGGLGVVAMVGLWFSLPKGSAGERPDVKELSVLMRPQVLSALLTTVLGPGRCLPSIPIFHRCCTPLPTPHRCLSPRCWC
jgi:DHA1 family inner membrane transport protein